jgi:hypothetical protein
MIACQILRTLFERMRRPRLRGLIQEAATEDPPPPTVLVCRTHDEVNAELARAWCDDCGMDFRPADQREPLLPDDARALVIDLNHLGLDSRERVQFVERLCHVLPPYPVAVASYDLTPAAKSMLLSRGWLIFRHIDRRLFYELAGTLTDEWQIVAYRTPAGGTIR